MRGFYFWSSSPPPGPPVQGLFSVGGPSTILRAVRAVVVDAVNGQPARWWLAHVSQEVLEFKPAVADRDAAAAVTLIGMILRIRASLFHLHPAEVSTGASHAVGTHQPTNRVPAKTSTTAGLARDQIRRHARSDSATIAAAFPALLPEFVSLWMQPQRGQSSESLSWFDQQLPHSAPILTQGVA